MKIVVTLASNGRYAGGNCFAIDKQGNLWILEIADKKVLNHTQIADVNEGYNVDMQLPVHNHKIACVIAVGQWVSVYGVEE